MVKGRRRACGAPTTRPGHLCTLPAVEESDRCRRHAWLSGVHVPRGATWVTDPAAGCVIDVCLIIGPDYGRSRCLRHDTLEFEVATALGAQTPRCHQRTVETPAGYEIAVPRLPTWPQRVVSQTLRGLTRTARYSYDQRWLDRMGGQCWWPAIVKAVAMNPATAPRTLAKIVDRTVNQAEMAEAAPVLAAILADRADLPNRARERLRAHLQADTDLAERCVDRHGAILDWLSDHPEQLIAKEARARRVERESRLARL